MICFAVLSASSNDSLQAVVNYSVPMHCDHVKEFVSWVHFLSILKLRQLYEMGPRLVIGKQAYILV